MRSLFVLPLLAGLLLPLASCSGDDAEEHCGFDVWYRAATPQARVYVVGDWDGYARPGLALPDLGRDDGYRHHHFPFAPGTYHYYLVEDGVRSLDPLVPTSAFAEEQEVTLVEAPDCSLPRLGITRAQGQADGHAVVEAQFDRALDRSPLDANGVLLATLDGTPVQAAARADVETGALRFELQGLATGKHRFVVSASDAQGRRSERPLSVWVEPEPVQADDLIIYQVLTDRFRRDDHAVPQPAQAAARAGGNLRGIISALRDGELTRIGANALWISPLYDNPEGMFPGEPGREYSGYHGYWPAAPRSVEPEFGTEAELDTLMHEAHVRGIRVFFDLVPNHVHDTHPYFRDRGSDAEFNGTDGSCVCGSATCPWDRYIQTCWFAPYLPDFNGRDDANAKRNADDAVWWLERFGADGLRIDAIPMMPRAVTRRIVTAARQRLEHPGHDLFFVGETFTGAQGWPELRYQLGPHGLNSQFHFPLMWALRSTLATAQGSLGEIDAVMAEADKQFHESGAVMATMIGNHDVTRFASEAAFDAAGDGWTPAPQPELPLVYQKQRLALGLVLTLPGAPVIYYGDEVAMAGRRDPDSRHVLPAEDALLPEQRATRDHTRTLGMLRRCSLPLRRGVYEARVAEREVLAFVRRTEEHEALVVAARMPSASSVTVPGVTSPMQDALTGEQLVPGADGSLVVPLERWSLRVLLPSGDACVQSP